MNTTCGRCKTGELYFICNFHKNAALDTKCNQTKFTYQLFMCRKCGRGTIRICKY